MLQERVVGTVLSTIQPQKHTDDSCGMFFCWTVCATEETSPANTAPSRKSGWRNKVNKALQNPYKKKKTSRWCMFGDVNWMVILGQSSASGKSSASEWYSGQHVNWFAIFFVKNPTVCRHLSVLLDFQTSMFARIWLGIFWIYCMSI